MTLNLARQRQTGFTLIELVIVLVVVSILMAVALPAYQSQMQRGARAAAQAKMMDIANRQQQFLLADGAYASKATLETSGFSLEDVASDYTYTITVGTGTVPSFLVTLTPTGRQIPDGNLSINNEGVKLPADKW